MVVTDYQERGAEEQPHAKMRVARRRLTVSDYRNVAKEHGFEWVGSVLPTSALERTTWKCRAKGHFWETRYNKIYEGRRCPYCTEYWHKTSMDYERLAEHHGIEWTSEIIPNNTRLYTNWKLPDGTFFEQSYRNLRARASRIADGIQQPLEEHADGNV